MHRTALVMSWLLSALLLTLVGRADDRVLALDWQALKSEGQLLAGEVVAGAAADGTAALKLANDSSLPKKVDILVLVDPPITADQWHLAGMVRYQVPKGSGQFELLNVLSSGNYFTRTLASSGPMGRLEGASDWRPLWLPFDGSERGGKPSKLVLSLRLPPRATVEVGPLVLMDGYGDPTSVTPGAWWTEEAAMQASLVAAAALILLALALGIWGRRPGDHPWIRRVQLSVIGASLLGFAGGLVALATGQPYPVYFGLLLSGLLGAGLFGMSYRRAAGVPAAEQATEEG